MSVCTEIYTMIVFEETIILAKQPYIIKMLYIAVLLQTLSTKKKFKIKKMLC